LQTIDFNTTTSTQIRCQKMSRGIAALIRAAMVRPRNALLCFAALTAAHALVIPTGLSAQVQSSCDNSNRLKIVCTVTQPVVTQKDTAYPAIVFVPGDVVTVKADGCVQTGGKGLTWKRYVNPSGPNSDHLYHGLITIPTATGTLVRINTVTTKVITVPTGAGAPSMVLHLGYEDDDYSDNGYDKHDNGTTDQCIQTRPNIDGGPAHVTITIVRRQR
jgi:hypothetical protein